MASKPYMPLYIADYMADTAHLTMAEHGAYLLLLMNYWQTEKPLPDDDKKLAQICRTTLKGFRQIKLTVSLMFSKRGNTLVHPRVEKELEIFRRKSDVARVSAEKRWENYAKNNDDNAMRTHSERIANAMRTQCERNAIQITDTDTYPTAKAKEQKTVENLKLEDSLGLAGAESKKIRSAPTGQIKNSSPVFIFIPARGEGKEFGVTEKLVTEFELAYPLLDVRGWLQRMRAWSFSNEKKRKTVGGMLRFINNWLAAENDKLPTGLETRKLSAVEHNQLLLERRQANRYAENFKRLSAGEENDVPH